MLTWREQYKKSELRADEALAGSHNTGHGQVGHGVGCGVHPSETTAARSSARRDSLKSVFLSEAPDELLYSGVRHQV